MTGREASSLPAETDLSSNDSTITESRAQSQIIQFSPEQGKHQRLAQSASHKQQLERLQVQSAIDEEKRANEFRRTQDEKDRQYQLIRQQVMFFLSIASLLAFAVLALVLIFRPDDESGQDFGYTILSLIAGGFIGYITGLKTGG